jgi:hypothetical protein
MYDRKGTLHKTSFVYLHTVSAKHIPSRKQNAPQYALTDKSPWGYDVASLCYNDHVNAKPGGDLHAVNVVM